MKIAARARTFRLLPLAAWVVGLAACDGIPTAPAFPEDAPPTAFHVNWSAWVFGTHDVTLHGDTLVILRQADFQPDSARTSRVVPGPAEWKAFWRAADAAGVRSWPRECTDPGILDGGGYSVDISYAAGRIRASGVNAYPGRDGHCVKGGASTPELRAFMDAVGVLIERNFP